MPAAVIINPSGGMSAHTEHYYARLLADHDVAALMTASRLAVRETSSDQTRVGQSQSAADAVAVPLACQPSLGRSQIIVLGLSRGGTAALDVSVESYLDFLRARDVAFAAHIAVSPACMVQSENAHTRRFTRRGL